MQSERILQRIERLLADADAAIDDSDWARVRDRAENVLRLDPENADALAYLAAADRGEAAPNRSIRTDTADPARGEALEAPTSQPESFCDGRYQVLGFLGEGGKKRVYLAHDTKLDRDVAFALIKIDGLDEEGRTRIHREAQAMGRLGDHPHVVGVYDIGEENGQPYLVSQLMAGGDLQALIEGAPDHRIPLDHVLKIAGEICEALEHAHGKGVVHRDLKPGNVWLTAPSTGSGQAPATGSGQAIGTAKLGDFGLAMALDRSRLTQDGMVVGTVAYMPPEQATGGAVTPRSDLYSLGCLLYELICGRPPFIGDESVAIIGQHLNTPPVAPTWHRPDCPGGLEALILRLLEKDPARRPASAAEVGVLLASAARGPDEVTYPVPSTDGASPSPPLGPLYRPTFVGRESEVRQLRAAFDGATSGQGALVAVVGEPGIGKTAICEQLATYVSLRGGKSLVGHCYEEGSLSLPYLPFVEALRAYVLSREPERLKEELGSGASDVARIVSEIRDRVQVELRPPGDPDDDRWRLFQAVTGFLRNAASVQPLMLVLEDLHWADRGTLDLLLHVARNLQGARLLIIATYRDLEVDRAHPLSATLAELRRIGDFGRVLLRGLTVDDVHRMINALQGQEIRWSFAEAVHRQTEGNPLFVQEVLRYLIEEGLIVRKEGHWEGRRRETGEPLPEMSIPEGLRDVVGKRLSRLSERTNQVLSMAAVMGRDFRLDVLQKVAAVPDEEIDASLKEAIDRAIVEERPALGVLAFRFTHAFFRQTLYEEIFAAQRLRLHQQVARALEAVYARRLDEHASELAEHYAQSTDPADLEKALTYSELAARRAMGVFAYGEAARHLEQALKLQDVLDPDDKLKRCDLLLALGEAMLYMEEPRRVADTVAEEAFGLAEALKDSPRAARAAIQALEALTRAGTSASGGNPEGAPEFQEWAARADRHAEAGAIDRIYADLYFGLARMQAAGPAAGHPYLRRAAEQALELEDSAAFFAAASWAVARLMALRDYDLLGRLSAEALRRPREGARPRDAALILGSAGSGVLDRGDREAAEEAWRELDRLAERTRDVSAALSSMGRLAYLAFVDGRLDEARSLAESCRARADAAGVGVAGDWTVFDARIRSYLGEPFEPLLATVAGPGRLAAAQRAVILSWLGRGPEVAAIRARFGDVGADDDESGTHILGALLEASVGTGDAETAGALVRRLAPLAGQLLIGWGWSIGRLLGDGARLVGEPEQARGYYAQALETCEKIRFRPEIALIRLRLAELLLDESQVSGPKSQVGARTIGPETADVRLETAAEHLDFAIEEFEAMKMQPSLEQALRHKGLLKA